MWLNDYHVDGLRLDAIHAYIDRSAIHFMEQLSAEVERLGATIGRRFVLIAESDLNDPKFVRCHARPRLRYGRAVERRLSSFALHAAVVRSGPGLLRRLRHDGRPGEEPEVCLRIRRRLLGLSQPPAREAGGGAFAHHFLGYIQNHDQVGNRAVGERLEHLVGMDAAKVALGIVLTAPFVPMLFMGEEFARSTPFLYFADHEDEEMRRLVAEGRKRDFAAFGWDQSQIPDPENPETFERLEAELERGARGHAPVHVPVGQGADPPAADDGGAERRRPRAPEGRVPGGGQVPRHGTRASADPGEPRRQVCEDRPARG